ncbi:MAG: hypothetical protein P0Y50_10880 [Candidatus Brevundimonas colombiensis]|uniref:Transmembrane protein n=1 Tax=Candidatus Brevundimonas colombiensis TaxID=3121376 RepID=A0AAJ6BIP9_9CAUL|nr:hypothetical protein [Brevundimonas sp.]WEK39050.1 MAG: hypothetical protein P0Y50_10880 [Brevundimonas sp.]
MTDPDKDWSDLTQVWTAPAVGEPALDAHLIRELRMRDRLARLNFAGEIAGGVAVIALIAWATWTKGLPWSVALTALGFVGFALVMTLWSRSGDPGLLTDTPQVALRSALAQARAGLRWAWAGVAISIAGMAFMTTAALLLPGQRGTDHRLMAGLGGVLILCIGFYLRHAKLCRQRMAAHEATLNALADGSTKTL